MPTLTIYLILFIVVGCGFLAFNLLVGKLLRPNRPNPEKDEIYECGEPTIGSSWIQFDLRFYVVALLFVIFDVEMAFFFPWATVFGTSNKLANEELTPNERVQIVSNLTGEKPIDPGTFTPEKIADQKKAAKQLAWLSFWDILFFFGVLLVGFAYLWKRGDLAWVRSTAAQETPTNISAHQEPVLEHSS
jgi:NADH-quinone oxidoreductase subunit A